ncbi:methyl-CpG-binding domain protein 5-like [Paramormyrops kingsleyae]|uniref:methyl-CpG-binding domain protein 5-like n=1 Tax=Paramormyrops kingsleyae TaxID=1676925 RepID=UPI003B97CA1A
MNGGRECEGREREGPTPTAHVPIGWRREADPSRVVYISPSGSVLTCLEQVKTYLLTDGTCKCGLECPLVLPKVFNFDPGAAVKQRTAEDAKADGDVTKLCIHKRKIIAVAALRTSATPNLSTHSANPHAVRHKSQEGALTSVALNSKNPFKVLMAAQQTELSTGHPRPRPGGGEHGQRSPYRAGHSGLLSPASCGVLAYGDGPHSPRADGLGSPDAFTRPGLRGSPGLLHAHGRTPLSPPTAALRHSSPVPQPSCALAGRTSVSLSPTVAAKSPVMKKSPCVEAPRSLYNHKSHPPAQSPLPPPCVLQKKPVSSEKDPLGILDPIPNKPLAVIVPGFPASLHSQVPAMNVNMPPAIVPLPSNLPLPTVKPGPMGHGGHPQRLQQAVPTASVPPSPVTSPVHMAGPGASRLETSPQRSRSSSTSSDHAGFFAPSGPQPKAPPRSPRSSVCSPRPCVPSSPSSKPDQLLAAMNSVVGGQAGSMFPPASVGSGPQKGHPGLLGMPLNQILSQQNATSFPASSLLSAAAKAQLANQNKLGSDGGGAGGGTGDAHSTLTPMLPAGEGQSGRAALRDKLMAQQREALHKRRPPSDAVLGMLKSHMGVARPPAPQKPLRKALPPPTSMAQLLQTMSCQNSQVLPSRSSGPGRLGPSQQSAVTPQQLHVSGSVPYRFCGDTRLAQGRGHSLHGPFTGAAGQTMGFGLQGAGGRLGNVTLGHQNPHTHPHQAQGYGHSRTSAGPPTAAPNGESCTQLEQGDTSPLSCALGSPQLGHLQSLVGHGHTAPQQSRLPLAAGPGGPGFQSTHPFTDNGFPKPPPANPMACLFQNFQVSLPGGIAVPSKHAGSQSGTSSLPEAAGATALQQMPDGVGEPRPPHLPPPTGPHGAEGLPGGRVDSVDAIYRAVVDAASKGVHVKITAAVGGATQGSPVSALSAMSAFAGEPISLAHAVSAVARGQRPLCQEAEPQHQARPHRNTGQGLGTPDPARFRSPGHGTPRRQWEVEASADSGGTQWWGDEFLECSTHMRSSPCSGQPPGPVERPRFLEESLHFSSCQRAIERCTHVNGGPPPPVRSYAEALPPPRQELPSDDQSPSSSTSLEGPLVRDYSHYNGHYNGCAPSPTDTKSLSSEEELRQPDSPGELLHYRPPRTLHMGDLMWGQIKGFPPWTGKLAAVDPGLHPGMHSNQQARVEPEKLKTLTEELEVLDRASKLNRKGGKLNNHLQAAIHEAMSELDKMSSSVHQIPPRDRQVKPPKPKRRKISR